MIDDSRLAEWALENLEGEEFKMKKDRTYMISCGAKTYTWLVTSGAGFTISQNGFEDKELANTIWSPDCFIHSFEDDIMLPMHALTDCALTRYASDEFNEKVRADAELAWLLARHYHDQFTETLYRYKRMALMPSDERLVEIEENLRNMPALKDVKISDSILSLFMGMHRVSVSRLRAKISDTPPRRNNPKRKLH